MQTIFSQLAITNTPKFNPLIMNGLATHYMPFALEYLDAVFKSASKSFPPGLEYVNYERCTPLEEFDEVTRARNTKRQYDLAKSDIFLVKFYFKYEGEILPPRFIYLPFVGEGGIFSLGGTKYHMTPVLSDKVISPGIDSVFVKLLRDKLIFKRFYHSMIVDDKREMTQIVWSAIYRKGSSGNKVPKTTKALSTVAHYLFARYGVSQTFQKYCGFIPVIGGTEINAVTYPPSDWIICSSISIKPKTFIGRFYEPTTIKMAIPKNEWNLFSKALVSGFYYVVDNFPDRLKVADIDLTQTWMILLGHIIFSGHFSEGKLHGNIEKHFASIADYVDCIIVEKLKEIGYFVEDFYDLLAMILRDFNKIINQSAGNNNSVYNKNMEVLYYAMFDITAGIFKVNFKLNELVSKKLITKKDVIETFNKQLKPGAVFSLASGKVVASSLTYCGDHKYPKVTALVTEQENLPGANRSRKTRKSISERDRIHTSMLEVGSLLFLSKNNPTPVVRTNPFLNIDVATGNIIRNPKFIELLDSVQLTLNNLNSSAEISESLEE